MFEKRLAQEFIQLVNKVVCAIIIILKHIKVIQNPHHCNLKKNKAYYGKTSNNDRMGCTTWIGNPC